MTRLAKTLRRTGLMVFAAVLTAACAAGVVDAPKAEAPGKPQAPVHPALGITLPQSVFVNDLNAGKDPFYPNSTRRSPTIKLDKPAAPAVDRSGLLTLRGVSGPGDKRIALINNSTFVAGESGTVRTDSGLLKLRVLEVQEKSAWVQIEGELTRRELRVRELISNAIQIQTN
ncbi:MAG TPA: hypothetical protein VI454_01740 [Verrucomicrobiae bacterium]|jgi:hypothetical protein